MMKRTPTILLSIIFGVLIGYSLGYLKLPQFDENFDFFLGFGASLIAVILLILLKGRNTSLSFGKSLILFLAIFTAAYGAKLYLDSQRLLLIEQGKTEKAFLNGKLELIASELAMKQIQKVDLHIFRLEEKLKKESSISLSRKDIEDLVKLSVSLDSIKNYPSNDTSTASLSPGRGKLLIDLLTLKIDSTSLSSALRTINFSYADLRNVNLRNQDLRSIDLGFANMKHSRLDSAIFSNANLKEANLYSASMKNIQLNSSSLENANLQWTNLEGSNLSNSFFDGAELFNSNLIQANLDGSSGRFASLKGAKLNNASIIAADIFGVNLESADLSNANLSRARLRKAKLRRSTLTNCKLDSLIIDPDWFERNSGSKIIGYSSIESDYEIIKGTLLDFPLDKFYFKRK